MSGLQLFLVGVADRQEVELCADEFQRVLSFEDLNIGCFELRCI